MNLYSFLSVFTTEKGVEMATKTKRRLTVSQQSGNSVPTGALAKASQSLRGGATSFFYGRKNPILSKAGHTLLFFLNNPKCHALNQNCSLLSLDLLRYLFHKNAGTLPSYAKLSKEQAQEISALVYLLSYLDIKGAASLGPENKETLTPVLKNLKELQSSGPKPRSSKQGSGGEANTIGYGLVKSEFSTLKRAAEKKASSSISFWLKEAVIWVLLFLYALGCAVTVACALCAKFVSMVKSPLDPTKPLSSANYFPLLLPSIGTISLATFWTNIKIMRSDVEAFINQVIDKCKGHTTDSNENKNQKAKTDPKGINYMKLFVVFPISLVTGLVFGLITWHFTHTMFVSAQPYLAIILTVVNVLTETMLTYGVIEHYWMPLTKGAKHAVTSKDSKWAIIANKYHQKDLKQKILFWLLMALFSAAIIYGLYALCSIAIVAMGGIGCLKIVPFAIEVIFIAVAVVAQFPMYAMPCAHLSDYLSRVSLKRIIAAFKSLWPLCKKGLLSMVAAIQQQKARFSVCCLGGMAGCVVALGLTLGWSFFVAVPYVAVPACIGVGLLYGMWNFVNLFKENPPNVVGAGTNALGNGVLPDGVLGNVCGYFNSLFCGLYGEKEALEEKDRLMSKAADGTDAVLKLYVGKSPLSVVKVLNPVDQGNDKVQMNQGM